MAQISLARQALLAQNVNFRARVKAALLTAAISINTEPTTAGGQGPNTYQARHALVTAIMNGADPYVDRFSWAVAANANVATDSLQNPVGIIKSFAVNPAVIACAAPHGLTTGDVAEIDNALDVTLDGTWTVTVIDAIQFSVPVLGATDQQAKPGGTVTKQAPDTDVNAAVIAVWNAMAGVGVTISA
jgi:hypothetical protein